jgi:putative transposase
MQVFGLPDHIIRSGKLASRIAAQSPDNEAAIRRAAVARWRQAMADGLSAEQAAKAVGHSRASLYRWEKDAVLRSRRPHRVRSKTWSSALLRAVEALRLDYPMWGKAKLGPLLRAQGFVVSDATVGRILKSLVDRGVVTPVPSLRRRRHRWSAKRRFADRPHGALAGQTPASYLKARRANETQPSHMY